MQQYKTELKLRAWPTPQDYNEAVQNLHLNVSDAELKNGTVALSPLGIPQPITGAFASVYRVRCSGKDWALRCFLRDIPDSKKRYELISKFVQSDTLTYTVGFDFQPQGLRIGSLWYPVLKMEWVEGQTLDNHLRQTNPSFKQQLAERFKTMCLDLGKAGIAHGDLQHGNIIVRDNELYLVDYDGMFVPALGGSIANELGHRNYQHPARNAHTFDATLDNFSAWSIYTSLHALAEDPKLYEQLGAGEDCLLFRQEDYLNPLTSCAFAALENHASERIKSLARTVRSNLLRAPNQVPGLSVESAVQQSLPELVSGTPTARQHPRIVVDDAGSVHHDGNTPDWVHDFLKHRESPPLHTGNTPGNSFSQWSRTAGNQSQNPYPHSNALPLPLEPELTHPVPRKTCINSSNGRVSPVLWQFLNLLNPIFWMMFIAIISLCDDSALSSRGTSVPGTINSIALEHRSKGPDDYMVNYSYDFNSGNFVGHNTVDVSTGSRLKEGDNIKVLVLPDRPSVHMANLWGGDDQIALSTRTVGDWGSLWFFGLLNIAIELAIWWAPLRHRNLIRNGMATRGRISGKNTRTGSKGETYYTIDYHYTDSTTGRVARATMSANAAQYFKFAINDEVTVVYLPAYSPAREASVIYEFSYYHAKP